jgi:SSS family transporter
MTFLDWLIVGVFFLISIVIGLACTTRAGKSLEAYFVSNRQLSWWLAGTSIAATAFSSDTPLLVTGMVRRRGVWGVWEVWALGISTMMAVFVFAKLWKRANVMTEVELVELRYHGRAAASLRGFKALYWGLFYNCFIIGVWPITGMTKVLQETMGWTREHAILSAVLIGTVYTSLSGLWGVILTDAFQFVWMMLGAVILAIAAVHAAGGLEALVQRLDPAMIAVIPPIPHNTDWRGVLDSPFGWLLGLLLVQWWAWKNTDGGGVVVQRLVACKDERQAMRSVLWFNVVHYCLRSWPWVMTALASLVLIPNEALMNTVGGTAFVDHELAYPRLIMQILPVGLRGFLVASFFAAFLSTISTQLNWGASYLLHDGYQRFINRRASERHYLLVARLLPFVLAAGALWVAWWNRTIGASFTWILNLTAGIGPVYLLRWYWWRINPWSEIAAMSASLPILLIRPHVFAWWGLPTGLLPELLFMVLGTAFVWLPATLLTAPVDHATLARFYARVQPPGAWGAFARSRASRQEWRASLVQWGWGSLALLATTIGPLDIMLGRPRAGWAWLLVALIGWLGVRSARGAPTTRTAPPTAAPSRADSAHRSSE